LGTEAYANVPTKPTNSSKALSERFILFTFSLGSSRAAKLLASGGRNYTQNYLVVISVIIPHHIGIDLDVIVVTENGSTASTFTYSEVYAQNLK